MGDGKMINGLGYDKRTSWKWEPDGVDGPSVLLTWTPYSKNERGHFSILSIGPKEARRVVDLSWLLYEPDAREAVETRPNNVMRAVLEKNASLRETLFGYCKQLEASWVRDQLEKECVLNMGRRKSWVSI